MAGCAGDDGGTADPASGDAQAVNPFAEADMYADPSSRAAPAAAAAEQAGDAEQQRVLDRLAATPQGIWLTPEEHPAGEVGGYVTSIVAGADEAGRVPTFVVYGIPDRDCTGGYSEGGLTSDDYGPWVQEIADAAGAGDRAVAWSNPTRSPRRSSAGTGATSGSG